MTISYATTLRNARLDAISTAVGSAGKLRIYNGTRPATGGTVTTLLAELTLGSPFASAAASGVLTANAITGDTSADATGTATWFRIVTSGGTFVLDGDVGTAGPAELVLSSTSLVAGGTVNVSSLVITAGNA